MIGDAWTIDIEGALRAGIRPVWLNRFGQSSPNASVAEVTSLTPASDTFALLTSGR
jgi:FMN phosphatase YigB (HAD superfamily)